MGVCLSVSYFVRGAAHSYRSALWNAILGRCKYVCATNDEHATRVWKGWETASSAVGRKQLHGDGFNGLFKVRASCDGIIYVCSEGYMSLVFELIELRHYRN